MIQDVMADWLKPYDLNFWWLDKDICFIDGVNTYKPIVAIVFNLSPRLEDAFGSLGKVGIWTISNPGRPWDEFHPITIENPNFFRELSVILERAIIKYAKT